jgi:hypothetical protein
MPERLYDIYVATGRFRYVIPFMRHMAQNVTKDVRITGNYGMVRLS